MNTKDCMNLMVQVDGHITHADASDHCSQKTIDRLVKKGTLLLNHKTQMLRVSDSYYQIPVRFSGGRR